MKNELLNDAQPRDYTAMLKFLALAPHVKSKSASGTLLLICGVHKQSIKSSELALLAENGLVIRNQTQIVLSEQGHALLAAKQDRPDITISSKRIDGNRQILAVHNLESPLHGLVRKKTANGTSFLESAELDAGERLRIDFTRGMLMPRTSANWQTSISGGQRAGEENGIENLTNSALAARMRFEAAIKGLGADLAGVITDICCFLKGFEQVEMERGWPKRSAKFMLKAGLAVLAQHYWPKNTQNSSRLRKWGAPDYRPTIS